MADEYWATFSIYDHRESLYRRSLVLFDRVVIPIPKRPIGKQTQKELAALEADVEYLRKENAAVAFPWDSDKFHEWQKSVDGEMLAGVLAKDPLFATRALIKEELQKLAKEKLPPGVDSMTPMPVYGTREKYETAVKDLKANLTERLTLEVILKNIPVPADDVALEEIIEFRKQGEYRESLYELRKWLRKKVPELLKEDSDRALREAGEDFKHLVQRYENAMSEAKYKKVKTGVCSILALGAALAVGAAPLLATVSVLAPTLFSLKTLFTPCWRQVQEKECAPAGLVYLVSRL